MGDLFTTWFGPNGPVIHKPQSLKELLDYEWFVYMRCKTTHNSATLLVILINVLPEDGPFGPKHFVNKSPIHIINNPYL
jgi:hypothetical protein